MYFSLFGELQDWQVCTMFCSTILSIIQTCRRSRPEVLCIKGVLRNFTKFTGKHLCQSLFFNKIANPMPKKETLAHMFSCEYCKISKNTFCYKTPLACPCFWTCTFTKFSLLLSKIILEIIYLLKFENTIQIFEYYYLLLPILLYS